MWAYLFHQVAVYSLLPVRHIGSLDLGAESGEEEELRLAVAPAFFVTVQTTTRKLQVVRDHDFFKPIDCYDEGLVGF